MEGLQNTYQRTLYFDFLKIEHEKWKEKVRFFERRYEDILQLDTVDQIEIWLGYARACFELGNYHQYLALSEELLQSTIQHNITEVNGKDVLCELLFYKACSQYQIGQHHEAHYTFSELIKIKPQNTFYTKTYQRVLTAEVFKFPVSLKIFAVTNLIVFILGSLFDLLIAKTFFFDSIPFLDNIKIISLLMAFVPVAIFGLVKYFKGYHTLLKLLKYGAEKQKKNSSTSLHNI